MMKLPYHDRGDKIMDPLFLKAIPILKKLHNHGFEAYFVGGSVRDTVMNRPIHDIDIATSATPDEVISIFPKTVDVGAKHGTIIVVTNDGEMYEITTYRTEGTYSDNRRPDEVVFVTSLEEDLRRRDFTINAMAMSINGEIVDPFNGQDDIKNRWIRTVGAAQERFYEDALRMMRAVRFSSQLEFDIDSTTLHAMEEHSERLSSVSVERKTIEIIKLLKGKNVQRALQYLLETKLYLYLPNFHNKNQEILSMSRFNFSAFTSDSEIWTAVIISLKIQDVKTFLTDWKLPNKVIQQVLTNMKCMEEWKENSWTKLLLYKVGIETALECDNILSITNGEVSVKQVLLQMHEQLPIKHKNDLMINGNDILQIVNKKRGSWVKDMLEELERKVIAGELENRPDALKEWVENCKHI